MAAKKKKAAPWERSPPKKTRHTSLDAADKAKAKRRATKAGRRYPNLVDNMAVAKQKRGSRKKAAKKKTTR